MWVNSIKSFIGIIIMILIAVPASGQPVERAKEKIEAFKKMRILEVLEISGETADKFILRYNELDKDMKDRVAKYEDAINALEDAIRTQSDDKIIQEKSQNVLNAQKNIHKIIEDRPTYFKDVLNTEQLGKYLLFEKRFEDRLREMLVDSPKKARPGGGFGPRNR